MSNAVTCPNCQSEIQITDAIASQLSSQMRTQLESEFSSERANLNAARQQVEQQRAELDASKNELDERIRSGIAAQREQLLAIAKQKAMEDYSIELRDRDARVGELETKLKQALTNELELRKRERELESKAESLELEVARQIDAERDRIRDEAKHQIQEQQQLKDAEKEKQISELRQQINDLKRKAEQGSQQTQGEVQEIALEDLLESSFPTDTIDSIAKGVRGGDALQLVLDVTGLTCGGILWESKRTKHWSSTWLAKARDDQRAARAGCVVIVSEALPDGVRTFALMDGVWVCSWSCVVGLAAALRVGMIEVGKSKLGVQGQHEKMELVYNYLAGREFQQRVEGVVEAFTTMQADLDSEKRSVQRIWSKRQKQLQRALNNTAGMYGDLQGIIGASLPVIDGLAMPRLECTESIQDSDAQNLNTMEHQEIS